MSTNASKLPPDSAKTPTTEARRATGGAKLWFVWMVGMWVAFFALLKSAQLDQVATWVRDLPLIVELVLWLLMFPWLLATAVWTSGWSEALRVTLVVIFAAGWTIISIPRPKAPKTPRPDHR